MTRWIRTLFALATLLAAVPATADAPPRVRLDTSLGTIVIELDPVRAPVSTANFLAYVESGFYAGTVFHRVIDGFMIQGGGMDSAMKEKSTRAPIQNEARNGLSNRVGTIAMARTPDPHSATAQFFINVADNRRLDPPSFDGWGYAVFGKVVEGLDVVMKIKSVPTTRRGIHENVPVTPVTINGASRIPPVSQ